MKTMKPTNETSHTPGPYSISGIAGDNHVMALPALHQPCARVTVAIVTGWQGITLEEHEANKRLIAAAPDLLAALEKIYNDPHTACCCSEIAKVAIAKAKGKP